MERKIYYSFHDIPFGENYVARPKISFSNTEIKHLIISMIILIFAFAFAFSYPFYRHIRYLFNFAMPVSALSILTAFACHELAHKFMGQKYGYWSEYRMFPQGLLLALLLGTFTPFIFAAPGAVNIFGMPSKEEGGKIAMAGPLTNIILAMIIYLFSFLYLKNILQIVASINAYLALFNLIPFGPLDGRKIFAWDSRIWVSLLILAFIIWMWIAGGRGGI